ncbi:MAG: lysophospholipid acyltransferase family protein [Armatimonadota bacterium]|nr:lysophospholipid acyltransferase family protein [Armatimonadota bacterium]
MPLYWLIWILLRLILPVVGWWRVTGKENLPRKGGVIVAPNHISYADPPVVCAALGRQVRFMAKESLFKVSILGCLIRIVGAFPVKQKSADRTALRTAVRLIEEGRIVCIFPEGTRNTTSSLMKPELGIGMVAAKAKAPIIPMLISGTNRLLPPHSFFLRFAKVRVRIGKPIPLEDLYEKESGREVLEEIGLRVMKAIADLKAQDIEERVSLSRNHEKEIYK